MIRAAAITEPILTLVIGGIGAGLFALIGFPAAALTGPALAVTLAALLGAPVTIPKRLRDLCFLGLGISIGSSVTPDVLTTMLSWPVSFAILSLTLVASMVTSRILLQRLFGFDRRTAGLSATPGHLSFVLALGEDTRADVAAISLVQSTRVLFLTLILPPAIALLFDATGEAVLPTSLLSPLSGIVLLALAALVGFAFLRLRLPAAYLIAGMAVSAAGHLTDLTPGRPPDLLTALALLVMGSLIGTRFRGINLDLLRRTMLAGLTVVAVTMISAMLGAVMVLWLLGLSPALLLIAFAPGGVEAMAAIAVQIGVDPTFVAAHHVWRLVLLTFLMPLALGRSQRT